ncbi:erg26, C-3 sterol dehydrogenase [Lithohypha guttulata]|uniref:Erg26, C-3 sterol dehydrogenase n=1 Tax=Lithohypha guttulata TaxID=1690604 RepID=A0AAN7T5L8_9EURO|nr:erg26, C-3 sterol dehydrogenase [Lithohypha guttulata]
MASPLVFVTGGTGFVGSAIVRALLGKHPTWKLSVLDMSIDKGMCQERGITHPNVEFVAINILDIPSLNEAFQHRRPEAVIHVAGFVPPLEDRYRRRLWKQAYRINVDGTRNVLDAAKKVGVKAFVYTSTCCVVIDDYTQSYANIDERWPVVEQGTASIYGETKAVAESLVLQANGSVCEETKSTLLTCSIRPATTFGEGDHQLLPSIVSCIIDKNESVFQVGDGLNLWDTVYVGNSADAHVLALENLLSDDPSAAGEAFFIQNNEPTSFREFCLAVWKQYNGHVPSFTVPVPAGLAWVLGAVMEALTWFTHTPATLSRGSVNDATAIRYASGEKSRRILGYEPRFSTEEGLKRTCTEYRQRREKSGSHPKSNTEMLIQQLKASLN